MTRPVLDDGRRLWSTSDLEAAVVVATALLRREATRVLATVLDNGAAFVALDEAAARAGVVHLPLPGFFTPEQLEHALYSTGVDTLVACDERARHWPGMRWSSATVAGEPVATARLASRPVPLPHGTAKVTFTSGSTGAPKGVCLSADAMQRVARGLVTAMAPLEITRHLNALPFGLLLENVAGVLAPRLSGATIVTRPLATLGLGGSSSFDPIRFDAMVRTLRPHSVILLPQMLRAWCDWLVQSAQRAPASLRWVAVGGAAVGAPLIRAAQAVGIPAAEGYGLSEAGSVQSLNLPGASRPGSAGRALPHARLRIAPDGELLVSGTLFHGYVGDATPVPAWWRTGDLARIDDDGFLHVLGRKGSLLVTAYGRNVSPEWVEAVLGGRPEILHAVVLGDGQAELSAVLWPAHQEVGDRVLQAAVDAANASLPDYARIARWVRGHAAFHVSTGMATGNGRPRRHEICRAHAHALGLVSNHLA